MKFLESYLIFESKIDAIRVEIPYETYDKDSKGNFIPKTNIKGKSKIIDYAGRKIVVFNINGINAPFYLSTGSGGKKNVPIGKWYPFLGIASDGWFNKTSDLLINYMGLDTLKQIAQSLDIKIGDIRNDNSIPKVKSQGIHVDFINKDLDPAENGTPTTLIKFKKNLENYINKLKNLK